MESPCRYCHGTGKIPKEKCHTCRGEGVYRKQEEIEITVPAGIEGGEMIRLAGMGEAVAGGYRATSTSKSMSRLTRDLKKTGRTSSPSSMSNSPTRSLAPSTT